MINDINKKLANLPDDPGVYIMYAKDDTILYVGKAKNLKNRVRQYFQNSTNKTEKVLAMLSHVYDFRYIITASETDALSLENTLIKKHTPPYNILLKDDKQYPYVKVNLKEDYPKFVPTRKLAKDGFKYFGPITKGGIKSIMDILTSCFPLVTCNHNFNKLSKSFRPCLNYHIGRCMAPCIGNITPQQYRKYVDDAVDFLSGNNKKVLTILTEKMMLASEKQQYEQALMFRRQIDIVNQLNQQSVVVLPKNVNYDMFSIAGTTNHCVINHTMIRSGKVVFSDNIAVTDGGIDNAQTLSSFLVRYSEDANLSSELYTNIELLDSEEVSSVIQQLDGKKVVIACPKQGEKKKLVDMSYRNAVEYLSKSQAIIDRKHNSTIGAMQELQQLLNLQRLPKRMECFDISNISGVDKVASMVVFNNGKKDISQYRHFKIKTVEGANDFASMKEALSRRFARLNADDLAFPKPDLIVVDGGLGQLNYAKQAMDECNITDIELVSLAEKEELVYMLNSNQPIFLPRNSYALHLLTNIRDEAHRFAITHFRKLHGKNALKSVLSEIDGVGEKRQIALQRHFKSIDNIKNATTQQLQQVDGINKTVAENIVKYFSNN